jgi:signal transduction histidine kinase
MASLTAHDFAQEDKLLFRTVADRATGVVVQADLMDQLRQAVAFRERLMGIVSHDLRTPLASISLAAQSMLRQEPASSSAGKAAQKVKRAVDRMGRMISDLLDFTRIQAHAGLPIARSEVDLCSVVRETVDELEPAYPGRIELRTPKDHVLGLWDGDRLAQVVSNLVTNALEHGDAETPVQVEVEDSGTGVRLEVTNSGETIAPEELPLLFDPFRRATGETRGGGLGLGLHIVAEVARAHGGEVSVASRHRATTFTVTLPRTAPPEG